MLIVEKVNYLKTEHWSEWIETHTKVEDELSSKQTFYCVCGTLATGLHERNCRRFNNKVNSETAKRLKHLLPKKVAA